MAKLKMDPTFGADVEAFLISLQKMLEHLKLTISTPRWRLELK